MFIPNGFVLRHDPDLAINALQLSFAHQYQSQTAASHAIEVKTDTSKAGGDIPTLQKQDILTLRQYVHIA